MTIEEAASGVLLAGRYEIGPVIGHGSTASVHRARDLDTGEEVAVKLFTTGPSPADGGRDRREIDILTGLRHPGLVGFRAAGTAGDRLFVVMDLVRGGSLADALSLGPLPTAMVVRLGTELAGALAHVHSRGIVHRDVKPANILLDADDQPKLTDFGIARVTDATRVTGTGLVIGTAAYMAPEQVRGRVVGTPADVYALGLVLLEAVTGDREYPGAPVEAAIARLHRPPQVPAELPKRLGGALRRMTAADPADRPSAAEVAELLRGAAGPGIPAPRRSVHRLVPVAALAVLLSAVAGGVVALAPAAGSGTAGQTPPASATVAPSEPVGPAAATAPASDGGPAPTVAVVPVDHAAVDQPDGATAPPVPDRAPSAQEPAAPAAPAPAAPQVEAPSAATSAPDDDSAEDKAKKPKPERGKPDNAKASSSTGKK